MKTFWGSFAVTLIACGSYRLACRSGLDTKQAIEAALLGSMALFCLSASAVMIALTRMVVKDLRS